MRLALIAATLVLLVGCTGETKKYGVERGLSLQGRHRQQVWAVAPALNLSGQDHVDPLLQADIVYQQLQQVDGLTAVPVNRVAEVYASLRIEKVESEEQAHQVAELLGCDALLVPTVTAYDPYNPPKLGAALQLFVRERGSAAAQQAASAVDARELARQARGRSGVALDDHPSFTQVVGMFDAANGSVRQSLFEYAKGRNDPLGPLGEKEYLVNMDRYSGFVYQSLIEQLLEAQRRN